MKLSLKLPPLATNCQIQNIPVDSKPNQQEFNKMDEIRKVSLMLKKKFDPELAEYLSELETDGISHNQNKIVSEVIDYDFWITLFKGESSISEMNLINNFLDYFNMPSNPENNTHALNRIFKAKYAGVFSDSKPPVHIYTLNINENYNS